MAANDAYAITLQKVVTAMIFLLVVSNFFSFSSEKAWIQKYAKTMAQIEDEAETAKRIKEYYRQFCGWAEEFEMASTARKRVILSELLEKVEVGKGYQVTIRLKMSYQQFLDLCAPEDQPKNTLTKSHDEEVA